MDREQARFNMVEQQIRPCEIFDTKLLESLFSIKRENFVPKQYQDIAFSDVAIPLPGGQNMLCPRVIAKLLQELELNNTDKVLEIATGSGYVTALLAKTAEFVYSIEKSQQNLHFAADNLARTHINNVTLINADGNNGLDKNAPFDKIFIGGAFTVVPQQIKKQLKIGGILVGFVGDKSIMHAIKIKRCSETEFLAQNLFETRVEYLENVKASEFIF